jgi:DNA modification methylase
MPAKDSLQGTATRDGDYSPTSALLDDFIERIGRDHLVYTTKHGAQMHGDSSDLLQGLAGDSIDLLITSPPFPLLRQKSYGNEPQDAYCDWLCGFGAQIMRVLKPSGSFVIDLGGAYKRGLPTRSLHNYRVLLRLCDDTGFELAEEFFWYNPSKLPSPIEWVNKRKIRAKDAVNTVWWLSKTAWPKADIRHVLKPYTERMQQLLLDPTRFYTPAMRPSGHDISDRFATDNGGSLPSNLLTIPNTESTSPYLTLTKALGERRHPARFPAALPTFFIKMLTDPGDVVLDVFGGSNTTGYCAEREGRTWLTFEVDRDSACLSSLRFIGQGDTARARENLTRLRGGSPLTFV